MSEFKIILDNGFSISNFMQGDQNFLIQYLAEKEIYNNTLAIPYPYTQADADWWIDFNLKRYAENKGMSCNWALRDQENKLIGGIGFMDYVVGQSHKAELGYWLAKPYWGLGIMPNAVKRVCEFGFNKLGLVRITAHVFEFNQRSSSVLEKSGFLLEGVLKKNYKKDGKIFDARLYSLIR
jgi:[ribosomal protein S5]-alanine N-acetyltransferase